MVIKINRMKSIKGDCFAICRCDKPVFEYGIVGETDKNFNEGERVLVCKDCIGFARFFHIPKKETSD